MQPKVVIICDKGPRTSFGRIAESFRRALHNDFATTLLWLSNPKDSAAHGDGNAHCHSLSREFGRFTYPFQVSNFLRNINPQWIILIRPELGYLTPSIRQACPNSKVSLMIHDTFAETLYPNSLKFKLINRFWIKNADQVDGFFFNSNYTLNEAKQVFNLHGPQTICGCVIDPADFYPIDTPTDVLRTKWKLPSDKPILLNISLDEPRKNLATWYKLSTLLPEYHFVRIGPIGKELSKQLSEHSSNNLSHFNSLSLPELREMYKLADLFVYPSLLEGFGYPPLEALACGTPVVSSGTSAMAETLPGVATLVLAPLNIDEWQAKIRQAFTQNSFPTNTKVCLDQYSPSSFYKYLMDHYKILFNTSVS